MKDFSGIFTALVTPFYKGEADEESLKKIVRHQLDRGVSGFVVSGTTAESPCLTEAEKKRIFNLVRGEVAGQVPLIVGTGTNNTHEAIEWTKAAEAWGADAALVVVPYYNKPPQRGLIQHYKAIAESTKLPVILYNVPSRTVTRLEVDTIAELSHVKNIVGIKEATGDIEVGKKIMKACRPGFMMTSGDDGTFLNLTLEGGQGAISVASHILPKEFSSWCVRARKGDKSVLEEFEKIRALNDYLYVEANPIPVKAALFLMGLIRSPEMRLPLVSLGEPHMSELKNKLKSAGLL